MARLDEIAGLMNVELNESDLNKEKAKKKGKKRRAWLDDSNDNKVNAKENKTPSRKKKVEKTRKGGINYIDKNDLSSGLIKEVDGSENEKEKINYIDQPLKANEKKYSVDKPLIKSIEDLRGNPLKVIVYLYKVIASESEFITRKITLSEIRVSLVLSKDSARTALRFLLKNNVISRIEFKPGKNGWSQYSVKKSIYEEIKNKFNNGGIDPFNLNTDYLGFKEGGKGVQKVSSSNINTTTYNRNILPEDWQSIDHSPLDDDGFTEEHLIQIFKAQQKNPGAPLSAENIQNSIYAMAFDIKHNNAKDKARSSVVGMLTAMLKNGDPYSSVTPDKYLSPKMERMKQYLEAQKREMEQMAQMQEELFNMKFDAWQNTLNSSDRDDILKQFNTRVKFKSEGARKTTEEANLKNYYRDNFWESEKQSMPGIS